MSQERAIFAGGCFWCMVQPFEELPGILSVLSGYTGGTTQNPTYEDVLTHQTGHTEAVEIILLLNLKGGEKILEIGTGSGYQAAVLALICSQVYSIEIVEPLALKADETLKWLGYKNVEVEVGDGYQGWQEHAPFDGIIVTAAPDHIPQPLYDQLKIGAKLVLPVGNGNQDLMVITKTKEGMKKETVIPVRFVRMTGEAENPENK